MSYQGTIEYNVKDAPPALVAQTGGVFFCTKDIRMNNTDLDILRLLTWGRLRVDIENGLVYASRGGRINKPIGTTNYKGYLTACLRFMGRKINIRIHRVILLAKYGYIPANLQTNHINGNKKDNRIANLELITQQQNMAHAFASGLIKGGGLHNRYDAQRDSNGRYLSKQHPDYNRAYACVRRPKDGE